MRSNVDDLSMPLTVSLRSNDSTEVDVPGTVTIPANHASVIFSIVGVDDDLLDGTQTVTITASVPGYVDGANAVDVMDHEVLSIRFESNQIHEEDGSTIAIIGRQNSDISAPLLVSISGSDPTEATMAATVVIPGGQSETTLQIVSVDDSLLDGTQEVTFVVSAEGYSSGESALSVLDHETLTVSINGDTVSEANGILMGTVSAF